MVVYIGMENECTKGKLPKIVYQKLDQTLKPSCDCGFGSNRSSSLLPVACMHSSSQRKFSIKTGLPQNIELDVNTNLHFRPKKRRNYRYYLSHILLFFFVAQAVLNYMQSQQLREELAVTKKYVDMLGENLNSVSALVEQLENRMKQLEDNSNENLDKKHSVNKRDAELQPGLSNCNDTNRQARSVTRGPLAVHLRGALPEISVRDGGIISPWYVDKTASGVFLLTDGILGASKGIVEIVEEGLYFIYAQMYYLTSSSLNSYAINLQLADGRGREDVVVAVCSAEAATNKLSELSCYTAVVRYLHRGDRIYITQRERNRRIIFRDNKSFLGLTLLNSLHGVAQ